MNWLLQTSARVWEFLRDVNTVLRPCRFSAIVVAAGAALLFSSQGLEFTVRLPGEGPAKILWFYVCVFLWAFQSWYWARLLLDVTFGADRNAPLAHARFQRLRRLIKHTPRVLAAGSYLVALAGCLLAGWAASWIGIGLAVQGVLFYWFLVIRRTKIVDKLASANPDGSARSVTPRPTGSTRPWTPRGSGDVPPAPSDTARARRRAARTSSSPRTA